MNIYSSPQKGKTGLVFLLLLLLVNGTKAQFATAEKNFTGLQMNNTERLSLNFDRYSKFKMYPRQFAVEDTLPLDTHIKKSLLNDDPAYNKRYCFLIPFSEVIATNVLIWAGDRYIMNADYARIGTATWKYNLDNGWEWDRDRFGINFLGHPYTGSMYFNHARSNGYGYLESFPFAVEGSLMWEYFGENTRPSYNDIINTPLNGAFIGEMLYRISSNVLDDRTRGSERVFREILAGVIDPMRGFNRLVQGKTFRVLRKEVYQKEPMNFTFYGGIHKKNDAKKFFSGKVNEMINIQIDYGAPFESRTRKPFDFFKFRTEFSYGVGRKIIDNFTGYGILFGKNFLVGKLRVLAGAYQYYDYWDNNTFELGAPALGAGIISGLSVSKQSNLYTALHFAVIPFAGNSTRRPDTTSQVRDYNFGRGLEGKLETTFNLKTWVSVTFIAYYFWIKANIGPPGNNYIGIAEPRITVTLYKGLKVGFEQYLYYNDQSLPGSSFPGIHLRNTEQKIFLLYYLEDSKRKGQYN